MTKHSIPFTQFLRPDGRQKETFFDTDDEELADMGNDLAGKYNCRLEIEELMNGTVSMTVEKDDEDGDVFILAHELCHNGPEVPRRVDALIRKAWQQVAKSKKEHPV
jgi:hypothetical protein